MTDLEMTKLCAEAMRMIVRDHGVWIEAPAVRPGSGSYWYHPLHDDAQAMALLKKFPIHIDRLTDELVSVWMRGEHVSTGKDLNRAIVECVATMQKAKR